MMMSTKKTTFDDELKENDVSNKKPHKVMTHASSNVALRTIFGNINFVIVQLVV